MTPKQCHAVHCNSQQVEGSVGWDIHSSGDLHNWQMDGQDERSKRIYNQRDLRRKGAIRETQESFSGAISEEEKKNSSSDEAWGRTLTLPQLRRWQSCSPTILPDRWRSPCKGPVLEPVSLPNSLYWACWVWVRLHLQWKIPPPNQEPTSINLNNYYKKIILQNSVMKHLLSFTVHVIRTYIASQVPNSVLHIWTWSSAHSQVVGKWSYPCIVRHHLVCVGLYWWPYHIYILHCIDSSFSAILTITNVMPQIWLDID